MNTFILLLGIVYFMIIIYSMCTIASIYSRESVSLMDPGPALIIGVFKLISKICYKHKEG